MLENKGKISTMKQEVAVLSSEGLYTLFSARGLQIRFRTSPMLKRYIRVKEWDHGYLVVDADYSTIGITEEYIDITDVLNGLHINTDEFLQPIREVQIHYDRQGKDC